MKKIIVFFGIWTLVQTGYAQKAGDMEISFDHLFNGEQVVFDKSYTNVHGEDVKFTTINYFISNISLQRRDGSFYTIPQDSSYFIVRHTPEADLRKITLKDIPEGEYNGIRFVIGVDSLRNTMSIEHRTGNLDVAAGAKGMYWVWNSGYIFFKLEGTSTASTEKMKNRFTYHIGGFGGYRTKTINALWERKMEFLPVKVSPDLAGQLKITVNLDKFFHGHYDLRISEKPSVMWGIEAEKIADNYREAFVIK